MIPRVALGLFLLAVLVYAPGLGGGFVYDDEWFLVDNPRLEQVSLRHAFTSDFWTFLTENQAQPGRNQAVPSGQPLVYYRPLGLLAYAGLYRVFGLSPFAVHAASILLHAAATLAFFFFLTGALRPLQQQHGVAALAAALFAVHPLHAEAVAWMSALTELMAGAGVLIALALFVRGRLGLSLVAAALALLSKETALILPVLVFFVAASALGLGLWRGLRPAAPYALLVAIWLAVRFTWTSNPGTHSSGTLFRGVPIMAAAVAHYVRAFFFPWPLAVHYGLPAPGDLLGAGAAVAAFAAAWFFVARRRSEFKLAVGLAALPLLLPVVASPEFPEFLRVQDRYAYVAVAGACLAVALLLSGLGRRSFLLAGVLLVAAAAGGSLRQVRVWTNNETLWTHTLQVTPASKQASLALGYTLYMEGRFAEAAQVYRRALAYHPRDADLLSCLANVGGR